MYSHGFYVQTVTSKETNSCTAAHDPGLKAKHMDIGISHVLVFFVTGWPWSSAITQRAAALPCCQQQVRERDDEKVDGTYGHV